MPDQELNNAAYEGDSIMENIEAPNSTSANNSPKRSPEPEQQPQVNQALARKRLHDHRAYLGHSPGRVDGTRSDKVCLSKYRGRWGLNNPRHAYDSFDPDAILEPPPKLPAPPTSNWVEPSVASSKGSKDTKVTRDADRSNQLSKLDPFVQPASENQSNGSTGK